MKKNKSSKNLQENNNKINLDSDNDFLSNENNNLQNEKIISYGEFLSKNKNATKKERCNAIADFYKKLLG